MTTSFDDAMQRFTDEMKMRDWSEHTIRAYRRGMILFFDWLRREHAMTTIDDVTPAVVAAWRDEIERWNVVPSTKQLRLSAVKTFFAIAGADDVARSIELRKWQRHPAKLRAVPAPADVDAMIDAARSLREAAAIEVLYGAGLRGCELRELTRDDIDLENARVNVGRGKGGKSRVVPIGAPAVAALRSLMNKTRSKRLFAFSARTLRRIIARTSRWMYSPHRLRHAFATHLLQNGAQLDEVRQLLGHAWLDTTQRYVHVEPRDLAVVHSRFHPRR